MCRSLLLLPAALVLASLSFALLPSPASAGGNACHRLTGPREGAAEGGTATVEMVMNCFQPLIMRVEPGTTVTFRNNDVAKHVVTGAGFEWGDADELAEDQSVRETFTRPGIYPYSCYLHVAMSGVIVVSEPDAGDNAELVSASNNRADSSGAASAAVAPSQDDGGFSALAAAGAGLLAGIVVTGSTLGFRRIRR